MQCKLTLTPAVFNSNGNETELDDAWMQV